MSQRIGRPRGRWLRRGQRAGNSLPQTSSLIPAASSRSRSVIPPAECSTRHPRVRAHPHHRPEECIDCGACEPECPVEAIFPEDALPQKWEPFVKINYAFGEAAFPPQARGVLPQRGRGLRPPITASACLGVHDGDHGSFRRSPENGRFAAGKPQGPGSVLFGGRDGLVCLLPLPDARKYCHNGAWPSPIFSRRRSAEQTSSRHDANPPPELHAATTPTRTTQTSRHRATSRGTLLTLLP